MVQYRSQRDMLSINADYKVEKGQYFKKAKHSEWLLRITLLSLAGGELLMHTHRRSYLKYKGSAMHLEVSYFTAY